MTLLKTWWVDLLSLVTAIAALAATVAILAKFNEKVQPAWPFAINLNTLIAIVSTLLRACMAVVAEEGKFLSSRCHHLLLLCSHQPAQVDDVSTSKTTAKFRPSRFSCSRSMGVAAAIAQDEVNLWCSVTILMARMTDSQQGPIAP